MAGPKTYRGLRGVQILSSPADVQKFSYDREPSKEDLPPEPKKKRTRRKKKVLAKPPKATTPGSKPKVKKKSGPKSKKKVSKAPVKKSSTKKAPVKKSSTKKAPKKKVAKSKPKPIVDYKKWSFKDLYDLAIVLDIPGRSGKLKGPLITAIKRAERKSR